MRRSVVFFVFIFCGIFTVRSQQIAQYSQWFWNQLAINPAHAGIKTCTEIKTIYRAQWLGLEGAPNSGAFTFSAPLYTKRKKYLSARQGLGVKFDRDQLGPFTANRFNVSYAGHFNFSRDNRLSIGLSAGIKQFNYDKGKATTLVSDPLINSSNSFIAPDATVGFWWNGENYYIGLAESELTRSVWQGISSDSRFKFHTMINGGYRWYIQEGITLLPSAMLRIPPKGPASLDLNVLVDLKNQFGVGLGYRNSDAVMLFLNFKFKEQFSIGYSFDYVTSILGRNQYFSHEISLSFSSCKSVGTSATSCPLF